MVSCIALLLALALLFPAAAVPAEPAPPADANQEVAAWADALFAQDVCGNFVNPDDYRISALNLSNAAAVVLYEALRQTGFKGM